MNPRRRRHAAGRQAASLALASAGGGIGVVLHHQQPAAEDELAIPIGELRSEGFELKLLNESAARERSRRFVAAHARQLARSIERSRDELASLQPAPQQAGTRAAALERSAPLLDAAAQLRAGRGSLDPAAAARLVATAEQLKSLEDALKR